MKIILSLIITALITSTAIAECKISVTTLLSERKVNRIVRDTLHSKGYTFVDADISVPAISLRKVGQPVMDRYGNWEQEGYLSFSYYPANSRESTQNWRGFDDFERNFQTCPNP